MLNVQSSSAPEKGKTRQTSYPEIETVAADSLQDTPYLREGF
jgi:hypothetical protein